MGQNRVKILRVFTVLLCSVLWRRDAHTATDAGELVHASTIAPRLRRLSAALILSRAREASPPFQLSSPSRSRRAELGLDAVTRRAGQPSPPQPDSAHPNLPSFALDLLHPSPRSAALKPSRNRGPDRAAIAVLLRSSASPSNSLLRPSYARNRASVSFPAPPSTSLTFSPPKSGTAAAGSPSRRRGHSARRARTPPTALREPRGPRPRAPQPPALADRAPAA